MNRLGARVLFVLALVLAFPAPFAAAQQGATVRFSNWEFTPPPMMEKAEQTADRLVFKLDKSVPGPGGTLTLQAGRPLQGTLAARLDAEWKRLTKGRKLLEVKPDNRTELMDGTEGLAREATTANGGFFSITVFAAPNNGVDLLQMDAADDMATQMLGGTTVGFFMSIKLHPVGGEAAAAAPAASPAETPQQELARLQKEMREAPPSSFDMPELSAPAPAAAEPRDVDPIPVPKRDDARIASIPSRVLHDEEIPNYVRKTAALVEAKLGPEIRSAGESVLREIRKKSREPVAVENGAIGMYAVGNLRMALYLMGKAALASPSDPNTLNNYAALLSMGRAEQRAIVILRNLESKFPNDPTVLNNVGQAWFGLGDIDRADQYLSRVIRLRPGHSQANFTKSVIEEKKGNKNAAKESMKRSLKSGYGDDKVGQLERLGYEPNAADIGWDVPPKEDPLKLHQFLYLIPPYTQDAKEQWRAFREAMGEARRSMDETQEALDPAQQEEARRIRLEMMAGKKRASPVAIRHTLKFITYGRHEELLAEMKRRDQEDRHDYEKVDAMRLRLKAILDNPNIECETMHKAVKRFVEDANAIWSNMQSEARLYQRIRWLEEYANYFRYLPGGGEAQYQYAIAGLKARFLGMLEGLRYEDETSTPQVELCSPGQAAQKKRIELPHFEDLHCESKFSLWFPGIGTIRGDCHYLETEFSAFFLGGSTKENLLTGEFERGTVEVNVDIGKSEGNPSANFKAGMGAKAGAFLEFNENGITDAGITAMAEAGLGLDTDDVSNPLGVSAGATARMGINSGVSITGEGVLDGMSVQ